MNKNAKELAMHEKDTGSSEIQIALLTEKIETLSKHIKQFKKDKHSSVGLLRAVNRRKKLLDYLKRNKMDSYKNVLLMLSLIMEEEVELLLEQVKDRLNLLQKCLKVSRVDLDKTFWVKELITPAGQ